MDLVSHLLVIFACLALSAFFSGSEVALLRLGTHRVDSDVKTARNPSVLAARNLLSSTSRLLVTILLGNNVVNILGASVASALAIYYLGEARGIFVATLLMTGIVLVFCEVLPKAFAARHPRQVAYAVALPLYLMHSLLRPVHAAFDRLIDPFVRWVAGGREGESSASSPEEVLRLARRARQGQPDGSPLAIIGAAAEASERTVGEIMVPRTEIVSFGVETPPSELLDHVLSERFTRVFIHEQDVDHILGMVHLKDLIQLVRGGRGDLRSIAKTVLRVPERKPILRLLADMQRAFVHLAVVKDEFGVTLGMVTQEDILEEIVGEIRDEFDREELLTIRRVGDAAWEALGRIKVRDFNRETGLQVPAHPGDTLSGLLFNQLGRTPHPGDAIETGGYELRVLEVSGTRISQVRVERRPPLDQRAAQ